jgi:hypothetical protein
MLTLRLERQLTAFRILRQWRGLSMSILDVLVSVNLLLHFGIVSCRSVKGASCLGLAEIVKESICKSTIVAQS